MDLALSAAAQLLLLMAVRQLGKDRASLPWKGLPEFRLN